MAELELEAIRRAISKENAAWEARDSFLLQLPEEEERRRLGVLQDDDDLEQLRKQEPPDVVDLIAKEARIRLAQLPDLDLKRIREDLLALIAFRRHVGRLRHLGPLLLA
jgi:hypothetical protein